MTVKTELNNGPLMAITTSFRAVWRRIKLLRKAFFTNFLGFHYSQFGEDIILRELIKKNKSDGFFVDVGCYHPKKYSNTYALYKKGWRGINVDMEEDKILAFNMVRPQDYNVLCPVSDKREEKTIYRYGRYGLDTTISEDCAVRADVAPLDKKIVQTKSLNEIINESPYKGRQIDVLSIDVEGMDFKVINSLDLNVYKPKIVIIEDEHNNIEDILETDSYKLLRKNSYALRSWTFYSLIFVLHGADLLKDRENT